MTIAKDIEFAIKVWTLQRPLYFAAKLDTDLHFIRFPSSLFFIRGNPRGRGEEKIHRFSSTWLSIRTPASNRCRFSTRAVENQRGKDQRAKEGRKEGTCVCVRVYVRSSFELKMTGATLARFVKVRRTYPPIVIFRLYSPLSPCFSSRWNSSDRISRSFSFSFPSLENNHLCCRWRASNNLKKENLSVQRFLETKGNIGGGVLCLPASLFIIREPKRVRIQPDYELKTRSRGKGLLGHRRIRVNESIFNEMIDD